MFASIPVPVRLLLLTVLIAPAAFGRPNFVFVYTDDQRWDCLGVVQREMGEHARWPWFETPQMDRLAAEGIRFRNAFVVHSLCTPSRASFLTGQYTHTHRVMGNFTAFPASAVTYATELTKAGYATAYIGKWHMGSQGGKRPGFTYSASYLGQGRYFDCPFEINGKATATSGWVDDVATGYALDFIRQHKDGPFSVSIGYKSPHSRFEPPARLAEAFAGERMRPPVSFNIRPVYLGKVHIADPRYEKKRGNRPPGDPLNYFRVIRGVDQNLGRILDLLDELGIAGETMVIFTSDNGYQFGEHAIGDKRSAYEESMRIPMLVRYPKLELRGSTIDAMVANIDVAPTMLDMAGVPVPESMQGRSWKPLLEGKSSRVRDRLLYEYFFSFTDITDYEIQTADPPITPTMVAVRTASAKLITYPGRPWLELFDLTSDPYELDNLARHQAHRPLLERMQRELAAAKREVSFEIPPAAGQVPPEAIDPWINEEIDQ